MSKTIKTDSAFDDKSVLPAAQSDASPVEAQIPPSGVEIAQTYFSKSKRHLDVGVGYDGMVLDHRKYVNVFDDAGDEIPMDYRFCSSRAGQKEKNERGGFEALYVHPETNRPHPKELGGKPVPPVGGMTLCARKVEHQKMRQDHLVQMTMRQAQRKEAEIARFIQDEKIPESLVQTRHTKE